MILVLPLRRIVFREAKVARDFFLTTVLGTIICFAASAQSHTYQSFNITPSTSVCIDGTTTYTYSGPISTLTWSVTGGTFVGSNVGSSVQVKWTSTSNSLSAAGDDTNCWYDPEYWPPQEFCDIITYTSNAFSVNPSVVGGSVSSSTTLCSPGSGTLTLSGHTGSVARWEYSAGGSWTTVSNTTTTLNYSSLTVTRDYRAVLQSGSCYQNSSTATVTINAVSVGGAVSGGTTVCSPASGTLTLSGHTGSVLRWEYSTGGSWTTISNTTTTLNYSSLTATRNYRAIVKNGVCAEAQSSTATITVDSPTVGGNTSGSNTYCATGTGSLTLSGHTGSVLRWEYSTGGSWTTISNTTTTLNYSGLTATTSYRAVVKSGACSEANSSTATVTINPTSVGGTVNGSTTYYAPGTGTLTLSGHTGSVVRWEYSTGGSWTTISNTTTTLNYNSLTVTTSYRVVVKSGICAEVTSATATIGIYPPIVVTPPIPNPIAPGGSVTLSANAGYYSYQWYFNGSPIETDGTLQQYDAKEPGIYYVQVKGSVNAPTLNSANDTVRSLVEKYDKVLNSVSSITVLSEGVAENANLYSLPVTSIATSVVYADGLGRAIQSIGVGQSPSGGDMIIHTAYRKFGLVDTTYLPYSASTHDGSFHKNAIRGTTSEGSYVTSEQRNFYQNTAKVAQDSYPYAVSLFANDPTLRVYEQGAPGLDWQPNSAHHTIRSTMALNNSTTYKVRYWDTSGSTSGIYPDNSVSVSIRTDENGNKVQSYTDPRGLTVLKQVQIDETLENVATTWLETYYIYDEFGRIKYILPPKAMKVLGTDASLSANNSTVTELIHTFLYDSRGRLVEKKVPGAAVQYIVYDKLDRVVLTQDGNLRSPNNRWMFVKYDIENRVVYSGIYQNTTQTTRTAVQGLLDALDYTTSPWYEVEQSPVVHGYTNNAFPTSGTVANKILSVAYYDHYNFDRTGGDDYTYDASHLTGQETSRLISTRGLSTGGKRVVLDATGAETSYWITSVVFYDKYDRPIQTQTNNHLHTSWTGATLDKNTVIYDFAKALKTKTSHYQDASTSVTLEDYSDFDPAGRVLKTYRKINDGSPQLIAQYEYNALGQVVDKKLHDAGSGSFLQSVDYRYNIRGWLKSINNATLTSDASNDETNDYFGMELVYQSSESGMSNMPYYNGNISVTKWKGPGISGLTDQRSYKYSYDKSDRLKSATFQAHNGTNWTKEAGTLDETMTFDHNGNIKSLIRKQNLRGTTGITVTSSPQDLDYLSYTYASDLDKLTKVEDAATVSAGFINGVNTTTEYTYDSDGSLTADNNKGISSITYNMLGKPQVVNFTSQKKIEYVYDAAGTKLTVKTYQATTLLTCTNYSGSFVYEGSSPVLSFFGSPEGRTVKNGSNFEYQYALADHQGNTRALFTSVPPAPVTKFMNIEPTVPVDYEDSLANKVNAELFDHTDAGNDGNDYSQRLTGGSGAQVGIARRYKVYPGDKVRIEAYAKYFAISGSGNLNGFAAALLTAFSLPTPAQGETGTPQAGVNTWGSQVAGGNGQNNSSYPKAFVNLIVLDKNYKFLDFGWDGLSGGEQTSDPTKTAHDFMAQEYVAREEGWIYVYVSNESPTLVEVYFDDVTITHTKSNLIQYNEYYPFGMQTARSWTRPNSLNNNFLANGGTELNTTSQLYDLEYRHYDQVLGRMNGVDPMTTKYASLTPYNYSFNDPVTFTDASGADPWDSGPYAGSMLYYYAMQGSDGRGPGQAPLLVMDPFWSSATGWTTASWTWSSSAAGGYGMMAGFYSTPMAGGGLPPPMFRIGAGSSINISGVPDGAWSADMTSDAPGTFVSGEAIEAYVKNFGIIAGQKMFFGSGSSIIAFGQMPHLDTGEEFTGNINQIVYDSESGKESNSWVWKAPRVRAASNSWRTPWFFLDGFLHPELMNASTPFMSASVGANYAGAVLSITEGSLWIDSKISLGTFVTSAATERAKLSAGKGLVGKGGRYVGGVGTAATLVEAMFDGNGLTPGDIVRVGLSAWSAFGGAYGGAYGVFDLGVGIWSGTSFTDRIGAGIDYSMGVPKLPK